MVSIVDIAKECGVTPSTVSRALNGKDGVSEALRDKIIKTSVDLGYESNEKARWLATKESRQIGLILPDITSPYYAAIAKGVCDYLRPLGYSVLLCNSSRDRHEEKENIKMLQRQRVDGVVVISVTAKEEDLFSLLNSGIKVVAADVEIGPAFSSVVNDNYQGALMLFRHMIKCGSRNIGCILGEAQSQTTVDRLNALKRVLEENSIEFNKDNVVYTDATFENGYKKAKMLISKKIDSLFAINDIVALGVIKYCQDHGINIPHDLKVAGYDDLEIGSMIEVPLTTVHQRKVLLGRKAAELLLQKIKSHSEPLKIVLAPKLTVRSSCGENFL